jgi:hypothetical protein
MPKMVKL